MCIDDWLLIFVNNCFFFLGNLLVLENLRRSIVFFLVLLKVWLKVLIVVRGFFLVNVLWKLKMNMKINLFFGKFKVFFLIVGLGNLIVKGILKIGIGEVWAIVYVE